MATRNAPITLAQFRKALHTIWRPPLNLLTPNQERYQLMGIAISGGVDSMALAHLCSQLQKNGSTSDRNERLRFRAFIVDHKLRSDSAKEARKVAVEMRKMGIPATILRLSQHDLKWERQNFETEARRLRYRALGVACRLFRIRSLLCAHHNDDQAETVLVRMLNQKTGVGLQGMKPVNALPECHDIYGVGESGDILPRIALPNYLLFMDDDITTQHGMPINTYLGEAKERALLKIADGGITLYRPLLTFSKAQLIATCEQSGTQWYEDPTNQDLGLTLRNAVRSLLESRRLPSPLRKAGLLKLSDYWRDLAKTRNEAADALYNRLDIQRFHLRSGYLKIHLADNYLKEVDNIHVAARLLEKIMLLVSPEVAVPPDRVTRAITTLLPQFSSGKSEMMDYQNNGAVGLDHTGHIICGGVRWMRLEPPVQRRTQAVFSWLLTREPFSKLKRESRICRWTRHRNTAEESIWSTGDSSRLPLWNWQLWDNRFWLRPSHPTLKELIVRPLRPDDLGVFRHRIRNNKTRERLDRLLQVIAPQNVRHTLPAFAETVDGPVLGLPTLRIYDEFQGNELKCEVRYKKINLPQSQADDFYTLSTLLS